MPKYKIQVPEIHYQLVEVEAANQAEAVREVIDYGGDRVEGELEYSHVVEDYMLELLRECEDGEGFNYDWMIWEDKND
jgi:hypothetical protein